MPHKTYKKVALVILDGFGVAPASHGNAISNAKMPNLDYIVSSFPSLTLQASGPLVGLPWGEMGNSEVGHLNIGAGRIVGQDLPRITSAIQSGDFFKNPVLLEAIEHTKKNNSSLHLLGLVSAGGVHSFDEHLYALLSLAGENGLTKVFVHMFADGRDTEPKVALQDLQRLNERILRAGTGTVATVSGRFYAMDRGGHWGQTMLAYNALVNGQGEFALSAEECVRKNYEAQISDEMIKPTVILDKNNLPLAKISENDAVIFTNFRSDRALQLTECFIAPQNLPEEFRRPVINNLFFATMTAYSPSLPAKVVFKSTSLKNNLAEVLANNSFTQFHIAESEKYAHVTAFFNCGRTEKHPGEEREIITSPVNNLSNYVDHPEMSAAKLTETLVQKISQTNINFFLANFANPDMVGHTGSLRAAVLALEFIDKCLKKIVDACLLQDACLIIAADHGNVEQMINSKTGDIDKDHTTNPVPFLLVANEYKLAKPGDRGYVFLSTRTPTGVISDIAPTILELFGLPKPEEMTGLNLLNSIDSIPTKH